VWEAKLDKDVKKFQLLAGLIWDKSYEELTSLAEGRKMNVAISILSKESNPMNNRICKTETNKQ